MAVPNIVLCLIPAILALIGIRKLRERTWGYCKNNVKLSNKVAIVTGANSGIGYEIVKELAARDAQVVLACRNLKSAKAAITEIEKQLNRTVKLIAMELDLASLKSIEQFAINVQKICPEINLLINNAGVAYPKNQMHKTQDGIEMHFGVNHLGHFYLTNLLLETLKKSRPSRVVIVSSFLHEKGKIDLENLEGNIQGVNLYANSKLANVYFCRELSKRVENNGLNVYAVCPGWVYTSLFRHSVRWYHYILVAPIAFFFMRSPKQGAQTPIYCATDPSLTNESGLLYRNCSPYVSKIKFDDDIALKLWNESERLVSEKTK
ncbi:retinol dehydrogenase 11 [Asbolus verrucosus]|uniref:Retinol dehydrogenase 11 n=1 Tax=Asbolus verrucosus TaxID=1661398 RepID=A0A482VT12_ASBVE|nr:retinol dehydrogenase 11 [Asbolus verrucosus]